MNVRWIGVLIAAVLGALLIAIFLTPLGNQARLALSGGPAPALCVEMNNLKAQGVTFTDPSKAKEKAALFCTCLSDAARRTSSTWSIAAILVGLIGAFLTLLGGALGPMPNSVPGTLRSQRGILLAGTGALMIAFAVYANSRATAASNVAADAQSALALPDDQMFVACIRAKSFWIASRVDSAGLLLDRIGSKPPSTAHRQAEPTPES